MREKMRRRESDKVRVCENERERLRDRLKK